MIFGIAEPSDMAQHQFTPQAKLLPDGFPFGGIISKAVELNGIVEHPERLFTIKPAACRSGAGTEPGGIHCGKGTEQVLHHIFCPFSPAHRRMVMRDPVGHPCTLCPPEGKHAQGVHVGVNDLVSVLTEQPPDLPFILRQVGIFRHHIHPAAQLFDLFPLGQSRAFQRKKIKLNSGTVHVAVVVHHHHLHTAVVHIRHHLGHTDGLCVLLHGHTSSLRSQSSNQSRKLSSSV